MPEALAAAASKAPECSESAAAELHTASLRLRLLDDGDRALYHALHSSPEVMRAIGPILTADEIDARFGRVVRHNRSSRPGHRAWAIEAVGTPQRYGLTVLLRQGGRAEFGIMLLPSAWRRGVATRTLDLLLPHAFGAMGLDRVDASRREDDHVPVIDAMFAPFGFVRVPGLRPDETGWCLARMDWAARVPATPPAGRRHVCATPC